MTLARALAPGRFWGAGLDTCCKISSRHIVEGSAPAKHRWAVYHILAMGGGERTHAACISDVSVRCRCVYAGGSSAVLGCAGWFWTHRCVRTRPHGRRISLTQGLAGPEGRRGGKGSVAGGGTIPRRMRGERRISPPVRAGQAHGQKMPWRVTRNGTRRDRRVGGNIMIVH